MTTTIGAGTEASGVISDKGRVQLALNVADVEAATEFYAKLFDTPPAKTRPGYANFAIDAPPLKLVLIEKAESPGTINHLGVEVASTDAVADAEARMSDVGIDTRAEMNSACCYAVQDKVWIDAPDAVRWEVYTVLADSDRMAPEGSSAEACC